MGDTGGFGLASEVTPAAQGQAGGQPYSYATGEGATGQPQQTPVTGYGPPQSDAYGLAGEITTVAPGSDPLQVQAPATASAVQPMGGYGLASETQQPPPVAVPPAGGYGLASETQQPPTVSVPPAGGYGLAGETQQATAYTSQQQQGYGLASETQQPAGYGLASDVQRSSAAGGYGLAGEFAEESDSPLPGMDHAYVAQPRGAAPQQEEDAAQEDGAPLSAEARQRRALHEAPEGEEGTEMEPLEVISGIQREAERTIFLEVPTNVLGQPKPVPARRAALRAKTLPQQEYGLYVAPRPGVGTAALNKMEQRLTNSAPDAPRGAAGAGPSGRQLPTVTEQPEGEGQQQEVAVPSTVVGSKWLDENGLVIAVPDPTSRLKERPHRRNPPDARHLQRQRQIPGKHTGTGTSATRTYQLDIELKRADFTDHPLMSPEQLLASKLHAAYWAFKRRLGARLGPLYANRLDGLHEAILGAREEMFGAQERAAARAAADRVAVLEEEVAAVRQLRDGEDEAALQLVKTMRDAYDQIVSLRARQGFALTPLVLTLTPVAEPAQDPTAVMRENLAVQLLVAEQDYIEGLAAGPAPFEGCGERDGFPLRRVESTVAAHRAAVRDLHAKVALLRERESTGPDDPELLAAQAHLAALGDVPRRNRPEEYYQAALTNAIDRVRHGDLGTGRPMQKWDASLTLGVPVTDPADLPPGLRAVQEQMSKTKIFCKLYINGSEVGRSPEAALQSDDFTCALSHVFKVNVPRWPESAKVRILKAARKPVKLAEVELVVPGAGGTAPQDNMAQPYTFRAKVVSKPLVKELPQYDQSASSILRSDRFTAGKLFVRCAWRGDGNQDMDTLEDNPLATRMPGDARAAAASLMPVPPRQTLKKVVEGGALAIDVEDHDLQRLIRLDPNDPRNAIVDELQRTRQAMEVGAQSSKVFRLDAAHDEVGMTADRLQAKRIDILKQRWAAAQERAIASQRGKAGRIVAPLSPADIDSLVLMDLVKALGRTDAAAGKLDGAFSPTQDANLRWQHGCMAQFLEERAERIAAFAARVRSSLKVAKARKVLRTEDVVKDIPFPEFKPNLAFLVAALSQRRKLRPRRKPMQMLRTFPEHCDVSITVQRAAALPARASERGPGATGDSIYGAGGSRFGGSSRPRFVGSTGRYSVRGSVRGMGGRESAARGTDGFMASGMRGGTFREPDAMEGLDIPEEGLLSPYIEATFQGRTARSITSSGQDALWNEALLLPFEPPDGDYTPSALEACPDTILISVFDEVVRPTGAARGTPHDRRFLGSLHIPVAAIYKLGKVEATFELDVPAVLLGYRRGARAATLSLFLSMRPALMQPSATKEEMVEGETDDLRRAVGLWHAALGATHFGRNRTATATAFTPEGAAFLVPRYLAPTAPPPGYLSAGTSRFETQMRLARLVALMPFLDDTALSMRRSDIWTTNAEFVHLAAGDHEEHAVLLAGYFLAMGLEALVVSGVAITGSRTAFVLTTGKSSSGQDNSTLTTDGAEPFDEEATGKGGKGFNAGEYRLWNPVTGTCRHVTNLMCELQSVSTVFSSRNVWANVQARGEPWMIKWDLRVASNWKPLFSGELPVLGTVQTMPTYTDLPSAFYEELEARAEEEVRSAISHARGTYTTQPNKKVSRILKRLLRDVPESRFQISIAHAEAGGLVADAQAARTAQEAAEIEAQGAVANVRSARREPSVALRQLDKLQDEHMQAIARETGGHVAHGHILALPFSDGFADALGSAVLATGIQRTAGGESVRYAIATHVEQTGVAFACCVWVYVVCILDSYA